MPHPPPSLPMAARARVVVAGLVATALAGSGLWRWWRLHPTSRPFAQRLWVDFPHPFVTQQRLRRAVGPRPGQRVIAVGVGSGRYLVPIAGRLGDSGLAVGIDLHPDMLELTRIRSGRAGLGTVRVLAADAQALPFADATFDAAWFVSSLGQMPDPLLALGEAARVVRPGGHVVVGELAYDPHGVFLGELRRHAHAVGLEIDRRHGRWGGYVARLRVPEKVNGDRDGGPYAGALPDPGHADGGRELEQGLLPDPRLARG